jgi:hypothetical protein
VNVGLKKDKLGLPGAELGAMNAKKDMAFETGDSLIADVAPTIRPAIENARNIYRVSLSGLEEVNKYIQQIKSFIADGKATGFTAIATIIAFNKALDPKSVVKETEFEIAQNATGAIDSVKSSLASYTDGTNLTSDGIRALNEFVNIIDKQYQDGILKLREWALATANSYGIDDRAITLNKIPAPTGGAKVNTKEEPKVEQKQNANVLEAQGFGT